MRDFLKSNPRSNSESLKYEYKYEDRLGHLTKVQRFETSASQIKKVGKIIKKRLRTKLRYSAQ